MSNPLKPIYISLNTYELIKELAKAEDRSIRSWMDIAIGDIYGQKCKELDDNDEDLFA